MNTIINFSDSW